MDGISYVVANDEHDNSSGHDLQGIWYKKANKSALMKAFKKKPKIVWWPSKTEEPKKKK